MGKNRRAYKEYIARKRREKRIDEAIYRRYVLDLVKRVEAGDREAERELAEELASRPLAAKVVRQVLSRKSRKKKEAKEERGARCGVAVDLARPLGGGEAVPPGICSFRSRVRACGS